jgi:hypothetical protein
MRLSGHLRARLLDAAGVRSDIAPLVVCQKIFRENIPGKYSGKIFRENIPGKYSWPRLSIDAALGRMRDRLLGELRQRFPETSFYIDCTSGIDGSGRWTGGNHARVMRTDGPTKTTISTAVREHHDGASRPVVAQLSLTSLTKLDPVSEVSRAIEPCRVKQSKKRNRTRRGEVCHTR